MNKKALDLGCGSNPKNPFNVQEVYGVDARKDLGAKIFKADLAVDPIPFEDNFFDGVCAFDFIEHIPRLIYSPSRRYSFVELMNEIYRVLKPDGLFFSYTPAFPSAAAFKDLTHVNIITEETFPVYFDNLSRVASMYGFNGYFQIRDQKWNENETHLMTLMQKVRP